MRVREELLKKLPEEGLLKVTKSQPAELSKEKRAALIRRGNELFNRREYDLARKVFLTAGYSDGLIRLGDLYMKQEKPLEAFRMYWLAPDRRKVDALLEKTVEILRRWIEEQE